MFEEQMRSLSDGLQSYLTRNLILSENRTLASLMVDCIELLLATRSQRPLNVGEFHMYKGLLQDGRSFLASIEADQQHAVEVTTLN